MKNLIFNKEQFDLGNYSVNFKQVIEALTKSGVIMSEEASETAFKSIWYAGAKSGANHSINIYNEDEDMPVMTFYEFKEENL